jgi:hypothetical protein
VPFDSVQAEVARTSAGRTPDEGIDDMQQMEFRAKRLYDRIGPLAARLPGKHEIGGFAMRRDKKIP